MMNRRRLPGSVLRQAAAVGALLTAGALGGCATTPPAGSPAGGAVAAGSPSDPWESWNRKVFDFNQVVDDNVLAPVATAWRDVVPSIVRTGVTNVFNNFNDITSAANHLLQGKFQHGLEMGMRVLSNTFFGLGGLLDFATELRLERRPEDYGQTLAVWGVPPGPFLVLPFFGPSTVRDSMVVPAEFFIGPSANMFIDSWSTRAWVTTANIVNFRADLLDTTKLLDSIALDKYSFVRDAFLARRIELIWDGAPPLETFVDEPDDTPKAAAPGALPAAAPK
jgi:phospholipid-binding lipoprotein MlaA